MNGICCPGEGWGPSPWSLLLSLWTLRPAAPRGRRKGPEPGCCARGQREGASPGPVRPPGLLLSLCTGGVQRPWGGSLGNLDAADPAPQSVVLSFALSPWCVSVLSCCRVDTWFASPPVGGKQRGLSTGLVSAVHFPLQKEAATAPKQAGPLGVPCPAGGSLRVFPAFAQMSVLALGKSSFQGLLQPTKQGLRPQPEVSALGEAPPPSSPSAPRLALDLWLAGRTLFSPPGCRLRPSDAVPSEFRAKARGAAWASRVPLSLRSAARGRALPRVAPAGVGAGGHTAPWGSSEVSLVISSLSSTQQHPGVGRRWGGV